jgi:hypothetical protein
MVVSGIISSSTRRYSSPNSSCAIVSKYVVMAFTMPVSVGSEPDVVTTNRSNAVVLAGMIDVVGLEVVGTPPGENVGNGDGEVGARVEEGEAVTEGNAVTEGEGDNVLGTTIPIPDFIMLILELLFILLFVLELFVFILRLLFILLFILELLFDLDLLLIEALPLLDSRHCFDSSRRYNSRRRWGLHLSRKVTLMFLVHLILKCLRTTTACPKF